MLLASAAIIAGFILLVWSADRFIDGAAATAHYAGMSQLTIGMLIVGFGTSAPEIVVSIMAAIDGSPVLALGNALGSNIVNSGLVLGATALVAPIMVHSKIVKRELPFLLVISLVVGALFYDGSLTRLEAGVLSGGFFALLLWTAYTAMTTKEDHLAEEIEQEFNEVTLSLKMALFWLLVGFVVLLLSSRLLVWGAVEVATALGINNLIIGLTIVAIGTSLPELAASIIAARKGEHDIAIGNVVGSNLFNLLAVIGFAGVIAPVPSLPPEIFHRDWIAMLILTVGVFVMAIGVRGQGRINRIEGSLLIGVYCAYSLVLFNSL